MRSNDAMATALAYVNGSWPAHRQAMASGRLAGLTGPDGLAAAALEHSYALGEGEVSQSEVIEALDRALGQGPKVSPALASVLFRIRAALHAYHGRLDAAAADLAEMDRGQPLPHVDLRAMAAVAHWRQARLLADDKGALAALSRCSDQGPEPGSRAWLNIEVSRFQTELETWQVDRAAETLRRIDRFPVDLTAIGFAPRSVLAWVLAIAAGTYGRAEALRPRISTSEQRSSPGLIAEWSIRLDLALGRYRNVSNTMQAWGGNTGDPAHEMMRLQLSHEAVMMLRAEHALAAGDADACLSILEPIATTAVPQLRRNADLLRADAALSVRKADLAADLLQHWDPHSHSLPFAGIAIRLALLHGDLAQAKAHGQRLVCAGGPALWARALRFCHEAPLGLMGALLPDGQLAAPAQNETQAQPKRWRNTHERRRALRSLFRDHGSLTRQYLARYFSVAPGTITRDVDALIEEGLITRSQSSASSRSITFCICDEATLPGNQSP